MIKYENHNYQTLYMHERIRDALFFSRLDSNFGFGICSYDKWKEIQFIETLMSQSVCVIFPTAVCSVSVVSVYRYFLPFKTSHIK